MSTTTHRATYADIESLPAGVTGNLVDGVLHAFPRPAGRHAAAASGVGMDIGGPFMRGRGGPGGWWIISEPELHFGEDVVVPDIAGWRRERMPAYPTGVAVTLAPDWLAEVLSPSTTRFDRTVKLAVYAREGVRNVWLVDPAARTLEVLRLESSRYLILATHGGDERVRAEPFAAVDLDLDLLWLPDDPAPAPR